MMYINVMERAIPFNEFSDDTLQQLLDWTRSNVDYYLNTDLEKKVNFDTFTKLLDEKLKRNEI